jgi:hypothetical protein
VFLLVGHLLSYLAIDGEDAVNFNWEKTMYTADCMQDAWRTIAAGAE